MIILGIDPGVQRVGLGLLRSHGGKLEALTWMTSETSKQKDRGERLLEIADDLKKVIAGYKPDLAVVEKIYFQKNVKTAVGVAEARGIILLTLSEASIDVLEPSPREVKLAVTGDGNADKRQVQDMLVRTLALNETPTPDDAADALSLAMYGAVSAITAVA
jgi:crossover junction endodeoxyribonuclease RuvC